MVRVAHISDLHCGEVPARRLQYAREAINSQGSDVIVATGDITHSGRRREYEIAREFFASLNAPVVICPGNHDAPVFNPVARLFAPFARVQGLRLDSRWDSECGLVSIRAFNSARAVQARRDWSQGVYAPRDFLAMRASFPASAAFRVIACHHPPHTPPSGRMAIATRGLGRTLPLLAGEHLFLCGHLHYGAAYAVTGYPHLKVMTAPTLTSRRERGEAPGFNILHFAAGVQINTWRWTGHDYEPVPPDRAASKPVPFGIDAEQCAEP